MGSRTDNRAGRAIPAYCLVVQLTCGAQKGDIHSRGGGNEGQTAREKNYAPE